MNNLQSFAEQFVSSTRRYLFVRPEDGVLIPAPEHGASLEWTASDRQQAGAPNPCS
jgi:hypothetical protein